MKIARINSTNPNCQISTKAKSDKTYNVLANVTRRLKNQKNDSFTKLDEAAKNILEHKEISPATSEEFFNLPKFKQDELLLFAKFRKK